MTDISDSDFSRGIRIPQGFYTEFDFQVNETLPPPFPKPEHSKKLATGMGTYATHCREGDKNDC